MKPVDNSEIEAKLKALDWLESDKANGIDFYKGRDRVYAVTGGKSINAPTWVELVEILK